MWEFYKAKWENEHYWIVKRTRLILSSKLVIRRNHRFFTMYANHVLKINKGEQQEYRGKQLLFGISMLWWEQKCHVDDCYVCLTKTPEYNKKTREILRYPYLDSTIRPEPHSQNVSTEQFLQNRLNWKMRVIYVNLMKVVGMKVRQILWIHQQKNVETSTRSNLMIY